MHVARLYLSFILAAVGWVLATVGLFAAPPLVTRASLDNPFETPSRTPSRTPQAQPTDTFTPTASPSASATATITPSPSPTFTARPTRTASATPTEPGWSMTKIGVTLDRGRAAVFRITVDNKDRKAARKIIIVDALPATLSYRAHRMSVGTCTYKPARHVLRCRIEQLAPGHSVMLEIETESRAAGESIKNCARLRVSGREDGPPIRSCATLDFSLPR